MNCFPRTTVGGISLPRMIIGTNWFLGYSHTSLAKDMLIKKQMTPELMADIIEVFPDYGIDAIMGGPDERTCKAVEIAQQRTGKKIIKIFTPSFEIFEKRPAEISVEEALDTCAEMGTSICMPHQCVTDMLVNRKTECIDDIDKYTAMIRERGMIPGLSTHMPESIIFSDKNDSDIETYVQLYNAAGFLLQVETDWIMNVIKNSKKPVMTIKPLAAGRLLPPVGLAFVWSTIRKQDMVTIGTSSPEEAREDIEISLSILDGQVPDQALQKTRSKNSLVY